MKNENNESKVNSISNTQTNTPSSTKEEIEVLELEVDEKNLSETKIEKDQIIEIGKQSPINSDTLVESKKEQEVEPLVVTETKKEINTTPNLIYEVNDNNSKLEIKSKEPSMQRELEITSLKTNSKTPPPVIETTTSSNESKNNQLANKTVKDNKLVIIALSILLVLLIIFGYKIYLGNSKVLFNTVLNKGYYKFSELLSKSKENSITYNYTDPLTISGNLKIDSNLENLSNYSNYSYDFNMGFAPKEEKMNLYLSMNEDNEKILDCLIYITKNILHIKSDKIYPQVLYSDLGVNIFKELNNKESNSNYDYKDIDIIVKKSVNYLKEAVDEEKFVKKQVTLNVNGKEVTATRHLYTIDSEEAYNLTKSIHNAMKEDSEFIDVLAKITSTDRNEIEQKLKEYKVEKEDYENVKEIDFLIYTTGFFPKLFGLGLSNSTENVTYIMQENQGELKYITSDTVINAIVKDEEITGKVKNADKEIATFEVKTEDAENSNKTTIKFEAIESKTKATISLENKRITTEKLETNISISANIAETTEPTIININLNYNTEIGGTIDEITTEEAIDINELTIENQIQLWTNLQNAIKDTPLEYFISQHEIDK